MQIVLAVLLGCQRKDRHCGAVARVLQWGRGAPNPLLNVEHINSA